MSKITENEGKIITKKGNETHYLNSQSAQDIDDANQLLERVKSAVLKLSSEGQDTKSLKFRYKLGLFLKEMLEKESITSSLRKKFWSEVHEFTSAEALLGLPGGQSSKSGRHPFLEYCFLLADQFDKKTVFSLSWGTWNRIFDCPLILNDKRIIDWIIQNKKSIRIEELRFFLGITSKFLRKCDSTFLNDSELNEKCLLFLTISKRWFVGLELHFDGNLKNASEARRNQKAKYRGKYSDACLERTLFVESDEWQDICDDVFKDIYINL